MAYTWDKVTDDRIIKLHPEIRDNAIAFINAVDNKIGIKLRITQGLRTIQEQDDLYVIGRSKPGAIVTNAKGGRSPHNYGLAIDVCQMLDGKAIFNLDFSKIVSIAKECGFAWGGDWKSFKDKPHFEIMFGNTIDNLYNKVLNGKVIDKMYPII